MTDTNTASASPRPWAVSLDCITDEAGFIVATMAVGDSMRRDGAPDGATADANARLIVSAVNERDRLRDLVRRMMPTVEEAFATAKAIRKSVCGIFDMKDVDASEVDSVLRQWKALIAEARKVVKED